MQIVDGSLALAATSVIYEGVPTFPDPGPMWRIAERLGVNIFHTSPTAILGNCGKGWNEPNNNFQFKTMTTVGEPIEPAGVEMVLPHRREGSGRDHGHVVADRDRRRPHHDQTRIDRIEAGRNRPRRDPRDDHG